MNASGTYSIEYIDAAGFSSWDTVSVVLPATIIPPVQLAQDTTTCPNEVVCSNAGSPDFDYVWSNSTTGPQICVSGPVTISVVRTDTFGCISTDSMTVNLFTAPIATAGSDTAICPGDSAIFMAQSSVSCTYMWSPGGIAPQVVSYTAGDFILTAIDSNDCVDIDTVSLSIHPQPVVNGGPDEYVCPGGTTCIWVTPANQTCLWSNSSNTDTICVNLAGVYTVTCSDVNTCIATDSLEHPPENVHGQAPG